MIDMGRQIQTLLQEIEESNGNVPRVTESNLMDSERIISDRLVVFKNIEELQIRNQELLRVVRVLSEEKERIEKEKADVADEELKRSLAVS